MQIFIDSAKVSEIQKWLGYGVLDGVTTNPSIMLRDGLYDLERGAKQLSALVAPLPVSVEVTTDDPTEMLRQARKFAAWAANIVVKVPVIDRRGTPSLGVIKQLEGEGVKVNATIALSLAQVMLAAKAGATYVSIFAGRVSDEGGDAPRLIRNAVDWLERWKYKSQIIVGSIRGVIDVQDAALAGAHIITVPPQFLDLMMDHKYSRETVKQFIDDAKRAEEQIAKAVSGR